MNQSEASILCSCDYININERLAYKTIRVAYILLSLLGNLPFVWLPLSPMKGKAPDKKVGCDGE